MKHNLLLVLIVCVIALLFGAVTVTAQGPSPNGVAGALETADAAEVAAGASCR